VCPSHSPKIRKQKKGKKTPAKQLIQTVLPWAKPNLHQQIEDLIDNDPNYQEEMKQLLSLKCSPLSEQIQSKEIRVKYLSLQLEKARK